MGQVPSTSESLLLPLLNFIQSTTGMKTRRPFSYLFIGFMIGLIFRSTLGMYIYK